MIVGQKGSGVTTQIDLLCKKYKIGSLNLKEAFLAQMKKNKEARKRQRVLNIGFIPQEYEEQTEEQIEAGEEKVPIPIDQYEAEAEDFEAGKEEIEIIRQIMDSSKSMIIDGTWNNFEEGVTEIADGAGFTDLLI